MPLLINVYATLLAPPEPAFPHRLLARRDRSDPELLPHLQGFIGYVLQTGQGKMTSTLYHVMRHLQRVQHHYSVEVEEDDLPDFSGWAARANALCFLPDGSVRDPAGRVLVSRGEPAAEPDASVPYPDDARERKACSLQQLQALGVRVPASLPPVISVGEVSLRPADEVARRMLALFAVAVRAESLATSEPLAVEEILARVPPARAALTPLEQSFLQAATPTTQRIADFAWRYEALALLQWSLGLVDRLPLPDAICDVPQTARLALDHHDEAFIAAARLRPVTALLDALDLHLRLHWAVRQARLDPSEPPAGLNPGVISERHHALNWLVGFEDKPWDEVDTPT